MKPSKQIELSKLQVICTLFSKTVGNDLYYARQIKETIEASLPQRDRRLAEQFILRAKELVEKIEGNSDENGVSLINAQQENSPFSLLRLRAQLVAALKATCRYNSGLVVITGLKNSICPQGARWTEKRKREYEEAVAFSRNFTQDRSRPSAKMSLIIL
ncbi:hypothetical protein MLD52_20145 [Puniceicoccaceae bacterium K14]|nr:hypothetical protein [Puniceicoccaceae bacterium K14]